MFCSLGSHYFWLCYLLFCWSCNASAVYFFPLCGFLILSLASISGASGSKLTSETPMEELSPTLARYVRMLKGCIARACQTTDGRTDTPALSRGTSVPRQKKSQIGQALVISWVNMKEGPHTIIYILLYRGLHGLGLSLYNIVLVCAVPIIAIHSFRYKTNLLLKDSLILIVRPNSVDFCFTQS